MMLSMYLFCQELFNMLMKYHMWVLVQFSSASFLVYFLVNTLLCPGTHLRVTILFITLNYTFALRAKWLCGIIKTLLSLRMSFIMILSETFIDVSLAWKTGGKDSRHISTLVLFYTFEPSVYQIDFWYISFLFSFYIISEDIITTVFCLN